MKLNRLRCPNCGADFENVDVTEDQKLFKCTRLGCGATFVLDQGVRFADVKQAEAEKIGHFREEMKLALYPFDRHLAGHYAEDILTIIPDDYRAKAVLAVAQSGEQHISPLYNFLNSGIRCTPEELEEVFPVLLENSDYRGLTMLREVVKDTEPEDRQGQFIQKIDRQVEYLKRKTDDYADIPRDIFVCHSSVDLGIALKTINVLEADGNTCWYSERNMPPNSLYYWEKIQKAIQRCRIFLVCCSNSAMMSIPVQTELGYAEEAGVKRLELKLDDTPHTKLFAHFFDGISWVKLQDGNFDEAMDQLKEFVYQLKRSDPPAGQDEQDGQAQNEDPEQSQVIKPDLPPIVNPRPPEVIGFKPPVVGEPDPPQSVQPEPPRSVQPEPPQSVKPEPPQSVKPEPPQSVKPEPPQSVKPEPPQSAEPYPPQSAEPYPPQSSKNKTERGKGCLSVLVIIFVILSILYFLKLWKPSDVITYAETLISNISASIHVSTPMPTPMPTPTPITPLVSGEEFIFGKYEQDNNLKNGKEPVEWIVLTAADNKALAVSKYALDVKPYNMAKFTDVTWEDSFLREWLNKDFYINSFTSDEKSRIITMAGTTERIFLLSADEAEQYLTTKAARRCKPTAYAEAKGAYVYTSNDYEGNTWWWLRSPVSSGHTKGHVSHTGTIFVNNKYTDEENVAVRPAFWLQYSDGNSVEINYEESGSK